jgi:serpin B
MRNISRALTLVVLLGALGCDAEDGSSADQNTGGTSGPGGGGSSAYDSSVPSESGSGGTGSQSNDGSVASDTRTDSSAGSLDFQELKSEAVYQDNPDVPEADLEQLALDNSRFALDMYQQLATEYEGQNLFFSPYSISAALAMTYAAAENETERVMAETMHYTLPDARLHPAFNKQNILLNSRGQGAQGADGEPFRLRVVNSIWGREGYPFLSSFLDTLATDYGAGLRVLDFVNASEESRLIINGWVEEQTEQRIKDLLPEGSIHQYVVLVLVNAVYFNAGWLLKFQEEATRSGEFTDLSGAKVTAQMMSQLENFSYYQGDGYQALELLYDGRDMSMVLLVPDAERFDQFEQGLSVAQLQQTISGLQPMLVQLSMPKWEFETDSIRMREMFEALGMGLAFTFNADFSGMVENREVCIEDVYHKAFVAVDEAGTEAAAATAVVMRDESVPMVDVTLVIDRPFIYFIRDIETNTIVFMGRVTDPT